MASALEFSTRPVCQSGDICGEEAVESTMFPGISRFCEHHQAQLDEVRSQLKDRAFAKSHLNKADVIITFCETPGCPNRPVYGSDYCAECSGDE